MEVGLMKRILLKWKREWWKTCCWNGSGSDENNVAEMEAGLMRIMLLKWKRESWNKYCWSGSGSDEKNVVEMEAVLTIKLLYIATNCPQRIVRDELSATNCLPTNFPGTGVHIYCCGCSPLPIPFDWGVVLRSAEIPHWLLVYKLILVHTVSNIE